jgi:hypothetical protein
LRRLLPNNPEDFDTGVEYGILKVKIYPPQWVTEKRKMLNAKR